MQKNKKTEPLSVLILGGTKGIGLSIAKAFLNEGNQLPKLHKFVTGTLDSLNKGTVLRDYPEKFHRLSQ